MRQSSTHLLRIHRWSVLGAVFLAGCGEGGASTSQATAATSASATTTSASSADKLQALVRCAAAGERARAKRAAAPDEAYVELVRGCADIYSAPECRGAILETTRAPLGSGFAGVIRACRAAYCPRLAEPKPELCTAQIDENSLAWSPQWQAFTRRMLAHEMGVSEDELPKSFSAPFPDVPLPMPAPSAAAEAIVAGIEIRLDPKGAPVTTVERDGERLPFYLPASPAPPDFTPAVAAAIKRGGASTRVVVRADKGVPHATVIGLLDALKQQGVTHIALGTLPAR